VSPLEPEPPAVSEEIHLPAPTVVPFIELTILGGLLTVGCIVTWIRAARAAIDELPLD